MNVRELEPHGLWEIFADVCSIPHSSGHEGRLREYVLEFARKNKLSAQCDAAGNVLLAKPPVPGCENLKTVLMQGHLDMVPEKNSDCDFDFMTQPIQAVVDGDEVKAKNTTLGADNGIGIALALTVMTDENLRHGPLKALFTVEEETGLTGANSLDPDFIDADIMLNLDSEDEGQLFIGCAGGARVDFTMTPETIQSSPDSEFFEIKITGLLGGHSGCDIHRGRANAVKEAAALLKRLFAEVPGLDLLDIRGGDKDNAIPREAFIRLAAAGCKLAALRRIVVDFESGRRRVLADSEPGYKVSVENTPGAKLVLNRVFAQNLIAVLDECPNGVMAESREFPGVIETSTNLAAVKVCDGKIVILTSQRSLIDTERVKITDRIIRHFSGYGAEARISSEYPGWTPHADSEILKIAETACLRQTGKAPEIVVIHAGLECGIIGKKHSGLDMISFGPDITGPHAPGERVSISSTVRCLELLKNILIEIPPKK